MHNVAPAWLSIMIAAARAIGHHDTEAGYLQLAMLGPDCPPPVAEVQLIYGSYPDHDAARQGSDFPQRARRLNHRATARR